MLKKRRKILEDLQNSNSMNLAIILTKAAPIVLGFKSNYAGFKYGFKELNDVKEFFIYVLKKRLSHEVAISEILIPTFKKDAVP